MNDYRPLTSGEIEALQQNDCWAEDWTNVNVAEDFQPDFMRHVRMYGEVNIGSMNKPVTVGTGFDKHSGIYNATLRNVTIGDNCLIENIGNFISNYNIGTECYISNVGTIEVNEIPNYGEGNIISVLNEAGEGNIMLFSGLTAQLAAYMTIIEKDKEAQQKLFKIIQEDIKARVPEKGDIGESVNITNTKEIINCVVEQFCEIKGAERIIDCTLQGDGCDSAFIGTGVIMENCIISSGGCIDNGANLKNCFVGEACQITDGFTASSSVFFDNSYMANGEACAAFCGPFSVSHHKGSLLIGGQFSFYNAGSATNFSNHAYKMGPIHWGTLDRGSKTASGAYLFMPAHIGPYSVCLGKTMRHPDTSLFPFSYVIGKDEKTILKPGRNLTTVGLYRDITKWPKRDGRVMEHRDSHINQNWLSPYTAQKMMHAKQVLKRLISNNGDEESKEYTLQGAVISNHDAHVGIEYYDAALKMYMGDALAKFGGSSFCDEGYEPFVDAETVTDWVDLGGMFTTADWLYDFNEDLKGGKFQDIASIKEEFKMMHMSYKDYAYPFTHQLILEYYQLQEITDADAERVKQDGEKAQQWWMEMIEKDARKEYALGDVDEKTFTDFITTLWKEKPEKEKALEAKHAELPSASAQ